MPNIIAICWLLYWRDSSHCASDGLIRSFSYFSPAPSTGRPPILRCAIQVDWYRIAVAGVMSCSVTSRPPL
jgi:hypothetical protein